MDIDKTNTDKSNGKIIVYILIIGVIVALVYFSNKGNSERFSNDEMRPETKPELKRRMRRTNSMMRQRQETETTDDIDELVRRQAIATHQLHLAETEKSKTETAKVIPMAANVPPPQPTEIKPFEPEYRELQPELRHMQPEVNPLVQFAKDSQYMAVNYRPNDIYKQVPNDNGSFYELTADDRTLALMNQVDSNKNINDVACNLSITLSDADKQMVSDYKNKYYNMYAHQISCANGNGNLTGCAKRCYANGMSPTKCTTQACDSSMNELNNSADFVSLNQLILEKNNARPCSTCTQVPILSRAVGVQNILDQVSDFDNVSASFMDSQVLSQQPTGMRENFENLSNDLKAKDKELTKKKKVSFANVNNFANFNNYVNQNGVLETSVDKLAEIRSDVTNSATCGLNQYGQTISQVYDNLMSNPYMEYKKACDISKITGISDKKINDFQGNGNFGGNYGGDYAQV